MEHDIKFSRAEEAAANAILDLEIKKEEYAQVCSLERKKTKGNPGEGIPAASESLVAAKSAYKKAKQAVESVKLTTTTEIAKAFELYGNLLSNEARQPWEKIVQAQTTKDLWEDICGVTHDETPTKTWDSFMECITIHLQQVCRHDVGKAFKYNIMNTLRKRKAFQFVSFWCKLSSLIATLKLYHAYTIAQA
jgi:hypothetical protein